FSISAIILTQHLVSQGRFDEAEQAARLSPSTTDMLLTLVEAVRSPVGSEARARVLEQISDREMPLDLGGGTPQSAWLLLLGEREAAIDLLEGMLEGPLLGLEMLWLPVYDPIRDHPRYPAIVARLELPE
ncbi:MAG: hypothetical protein KJO06_07790, partial [Gemmatimonadetes bacterium]|nr:hypothetical protein [Gemmatimonadota bacterium]